MIHVYRLVKRKCLPQAFDGEAARLHGGRWNSQGSACVYCAGSRSLAMLEALLQLGNAGVTQHYALLELEIPRHHILNARGDTLPPDWRDHPAPPSAAAFGDAWLASGQSLALAVPSAIVPHEFNYLLNALHPAFPAIAALARESE